MMNINKPAPVTGRYDKDIQELNICLSRLVDEIIFLREGQLSRLESELGAIKEKVNEVIQSGT